MRCCNSRNEQKRMLSRCVTLGARCWVCIEKSPYLLVCRVAKKAEKKVESESPPLFCGIQTRRKREWKTQTGGALWE